MEKKYLIKNNFYKTYSEHIHKAHVAVSCAKEYILKNYKKIKDWSRLSVNIFDNKGERIYYCQNKLNVFGMTNKRFNPVKTIKNITLDTIDGDFSMTINGKDHLQINNDSVIDIANYIEKELKKK